MGTDGTPGQYASFGALLLVWWCVSAARIDPITATLFYLTVAMPLWHIINGEQHYSENGWDSYEVTLVYCCVLFYAGLHRTEAKHRIVHVCVAGALVGGMYEWHRWPGIAVAEVVCGIYIWWRLLQPASPGDTAHPLWEFVQLSGIRCHADTLPDSDI